MMKLETIKSVLEAANASEQKYVALHNVIRAALEKFDGKQITKRLETAVSKAMPGVLVRYSNDHFNNLHIWGGSTELHFDNRFTIYLGDYKAASFTLAYFDQHNQGSGKAALARIEARNRVLNSPEALQAVVDAANAYKAAGVALKNVLANLDTVAGVTFATGEVEGAVEAFVKG